MARLKNIHPGEVLLEEFLIPYEISAYRLSKDIGIPQTRVSEILKGRRRITADTALRLSVYFQNTPKFWIGLQTDFDLEEEKQALGKQLSQIPKFSSVEKTKRPEREDEETGDQRRKDRRPRDRREKTKRPETKRPAFRTGK
jgi:addiction module HigA family antidote